MPTAADRLIIAFDMPSLPEALALGKQLRGAARYAKIGSILFTAAGPGAVKAFKALGFEVFLDLKFHDIPSTVEKSCHAAAAHGVSLLTVHARGGQDMLEAAMRGVGSAARRPKVLAVTVLTSSAASQAQGGRRSVGEEVMRLAEDAVNARCDGVVASTQEVAAIRDEFGSANLLIVCPGIRPSGAVLNDQRRVATPREAIKRGANLLVVGRPITEADDPRQAAQRILAEMEE